MKKPTIFYKVVAYSRMSAGDVQYRSLSVSPRAKHCLEYAVGKWTTPKIEGSKIFVFQDLTAAQNFACKSYPIFSCEVKGKPIKPKVMSSNYEETDDVKRFWTSHRKMASHEKDCVPMGTIFVDAVKLVECVANAIV